MRIFNKAKKDDKGKKYTVRVPLDWYFEISVEAKNWKSAIRKAENIISEHICYLGWPYPASLIGLEWQFWDWDRMLEECEFELSDNIDK